jgi:type IV secretion system protein VirB10
VLAVLLTRGPDVVLAKGSTIEMVLDRPVTFDGTELDFTNSMPRARTGDGGGPLPSVKENRRRIGSRFPL